MCPLNSDCCLLVLELDFSLRPDFMNIKFKLPLLLICFSICQSFLGEWVGRMGGENRMQAIRVLKYRGSLGSAFNSTEQRNNAAFELCLNLNSTFWVGFSSQVRTDKSNVSMWAAF